MFSFLLFSFSAYAGNFTIGNYDLNGSRSIPSSAEPDLSKQKIEAIGLEVKWHTGTDAPLVAVPIVQDGVVYAATTDFGFVLGGSLYAMDADDGNILWQFSLSRPSGGALASPLVNKNAVYVAALNGTLFKLNRKTGDEIWRIKPNLHPFLDQTWTGPIRVFNGTKSLIILAINANDEGVGNTDLGVSGIVAIDDKTGMEEWRFLTTTPTEGGAGIWETSPSYSKNNNLIYVTTGQTAQATTEAPFFGSNAVFAIDARDGSMRWKTQVRDDDLWNFDIPFDPTDPGDTDIGDGAALFKMKGKEFIAVGSKRGYFYVMDALTGEIINGSGVDSLGFSIGLDAFDGGDPSGVIGPSVDGGYNLDSGYYKKGNRTIHFGILTDYTSGLIDVFNQVPPYDGRGAPRPSAGYVPGTCFIAGFGKSPECPGADSGNLILIAGDGSEELGRFTYAEANLFAPLYLDNMIFVHATPTPSGTPNSLLVLDVSDPTDPTLIESVPLSIEFPVPVTAFSGGANISIANGMIYSGNGFFGFGPQRGLFAIGLKDD